MNPSFTIDVDWPRDTLETADLSIWVEGICATQVEEVLERKRRDTVRLSVPKLAEWLAANWWRLRWEPEIPAEAGKNAVSDWNMSHNLAAAGGGYVWPTLWFISDRDNIVIRAERTDLDPAEPVRYLRSFTRVIPADSFEREVDRFVETAIGRMDRTNQSAREISDLWHAVTDERQDPGLAETRKLEAFLGYDPAEAPGTLLETLLERSGQYGRDAVEELAAYSKTDTLDTLEKLTQNAARNSQQVQVPESTELTHRLQSTPRNYQYTWERGEDAARIARNVWQIDRGPIPERTMADLFGTNCDDSPTGEPPPISAGIRNESNPEGFQACLRQRSRAGRRFALSRLVADHLTSRPEDNLLPATGSRTARQRLQRAFAREFLCPFEDLQEFIGHRHPGRDEIEDAADHFQVSELAVTNTLVYKGIIGREALADYGV